MSLFANRDWPYIKTKLKRLPTKIFLPKESTTVRPLAPLPAEQRKKGSYSTAQSGAARRIAHKERARGKRGHKGPQSHLRQSGQGSINGNPSATAFADAAVKEGVPPEIVQQLLKAAGGSAGTIAALAAAAVASAASEGRRGFSAVAEGSVGGASSRNAEQDGMEWKVSPGGADTSSDGYGINRFNGDGVINPPVLAASSVSRERGPAPVAVVSEAVVSSPPHRTEPGLVAAGGANEGAEVDGSGDYRERRRRRERSWSRSRGSHRGNGAGEDGEGEDTRQRHRKRPTRSPEGWRPWRPDDDSPTSPQRSRVEEIDGGSWREHGRRRRRVEEGRRRTGFDGGDGRGNGGAWGGFNGGYRSSYYGGMSKSDGFRTDYGHSWNDWSDWDGGFGRSSGFGRGNGYGRGGGFGRGNGGQSWGWRSSPSRRTGNAAWSPYQSSRWAGREHGRESHSAGEPGNNVEHVEGIDRRDSYDPDQYDPDAYDPGEVTVNRNGDDREGRKQRSISRSGSLTRMEERRRRSERSQSRSRSPGLSDKLDEDSIGNSVTEEERGGFNGSSR